MWGRWLEAIVVKGIAVLLLEICQGDWCDITYYQNLHRLSWGSCFKNWICGCRLLKVCNKRTVRLGGDGGKLKRLANFKASG